MLHEKTVAVVVPAYNEESQIHLVIDSMPAYVDRIIIVNDASKDMTLEKVKAYFNTPHNQTDLVLTSNLEADINRTIYNPADIIVQEENRKELAYFTRHEVLNDKPNKERIILINHIDNGGVGAAIATGYKWCKDHDIDCTAVMAGDGQMDPDELASICLPVITEGIDYVKGNRLIHRSAAILIPKVRYFGNSILSILTKIASGYWRVSDTQTGYTAISKPALNAIRLYDIYKRYGMPNDMLVKLNMAYCTLREVEIKPIYNVGEQSKMKVLKVIPKISWLLVKSFFKRLWIKYLFRDFHPLFIFYNLSFILGLISIPYAFKILRIALSGNDVNPVTLLVFVFLFISSFQSLLFAMWMDMLDSERLYK